MAAAPLTPAMLERKFSVVRVVFVFKPAVDAKVTAATAAEAVTVAAAAAGATSKRRGVYGAAPAIATTPGGEMSLNDKSSVRTAQSWAAKYWPATE